MVKIVKSNFLRDSVIKSVLNEYEIKSQEMSKDELTYGTEVIDPAYDPFQLEKLRDISGLHDICITVKCEDAIFTGKKIISKEGEEIPEGLDDFLNDFNFDGEIESFLEDLEAFGFAGLELLRENGELKSVNHVSSLYLRMCRDKKRVVQKIGHKENYFKLYDSDNIKQLNRETGLWDDNITDENRANDLIWFNLKSNESLVYGRPKYLSELDAILTDNAIIEYQQGHFKAHGIPNYIITVTGNVEEKEDYTFDDFEEDLEQEFREVSNEPGTALVFTIPSEENNVSVNVTKIADEKKEGSFLELSGSVGDRIRRIHRVPRERLGDSESTGIASNRTETLLKNYSKSTVATLQKRMANLINKTIIQKEFGIFTHKLEYLPVNFDEEDKVLDRGIKLLQNGAVTLGEFVNRFGESFDLKMSEDDEYYNCRFMNNQSLDKVLYGDDPIDAEGKLNSLINDLDNDMNY